MSETVSGVVKVARRAPSGVYSINVDEVWYSCGKKNPNVEKGEYITFDYEVNGTWKNVVVESITKAETPTVGPNQAIPPQGGSKDTYWADKDAKIQNHASRNSAIEAVRLLLDTGAIKLPAKEADRYDVVMEAIDEVAARYNRDNTNLVFGEAVAAGTDYNE